MLILSPIYILWVEVIHIYELIRECAQRQFIIIFFKWSAHLEGVPSLLSFKATPECKRGQQLVVNLYPPHQADPPVNQVWVFVPLLGGLGETTPRKRCQSVHSTGLLGSGVIFHAAYVCFLYFRKHRLQLPYMYFHQAHLPL